MKKKVLSAAIAMVLTVALLGGCGKSADKPADSTNQGTDSTQEGNTGVDLETMTATEFAYIMGNGINLGNTMEATGARSQYIDNGVINVSSGETSWGQPVTTQEMISGMKAAGFDTIRIPVAWCNMVNIEAGNYTIEQALIDRVSEIITYALNADMYVIVNDHWDSSWWGMFGSADATVRENAMTLYKSMWTQIATAYKDFDSRLVLEAANEELGDSLNDIRFQKDSGTLSEDECYATTNQINQAFVDTVRACGGYNENRFLLVAGYNTNIDRTIDDRFVIPADTAKEKILLSVHYYDPWTYCGDESTGNAWGSKSDYKYMDGQLEKMKKFSEAGVPVVIGEWGVLHLLDDPETGEKKEKDQIVDYMEAFLNLCDYYGYVPCLWETGALYSKYDAAMKFDDTAQLFLNRSFAAQSTMTQDELKDESRTAFDSKRVYAPESLADTDFAAGDASVAIATLMFQNASWGNGYSVGDTYAPDTSTGIVPTECEISGEGTYTVALDFSACGDNLGIQFSALAIYNGELLYPGYFAEITSIKINGEEAQTLAEGYTTSDNKICTRVNLYNEWVEKIPEEARKVDGDLSNASAWVLERKNEKVLISTQIDTLEVTFDYVAPESAESYVADRDAWAAGLAQ